MFRFVATDAYNNVYEKEYHKYEQGLRDFLKEYSRNAHLYINESMCVKVKCELNEKAIIVGYYMIFKKHKQNIAVSKEAYDEYVKFLRLNEE